MAEYAELVELRAGNDVPAGFQARMPSWLRTFARRARVLRTIKIVFMLMTPVLALTAGAQMQMVPGIATVAGNGTTGYSGDGGAATGAEMSNPSGIGFDGAGNYYIAEYNGCRIRKVTVATGHITTVAGTGTCANGADGGLAVSTTINNPNHRVAFDSIGNFYFAEPSNNKIRKVNVSTGVISTVAGTGTAGSTGDGGLATSAKLSGPGDVYIDGSDNLYIADSGNSKIRKVTASTGYISTVAGNGTAGSTGDGAAATSAELNSPQTVSLDSSGNIYIGDDGNSKIRKVTLSTGYISTVAGNGNYGYSGDGVPATSTALGSPEEVSFDNAGNFYIPEYTNNRVREVNIGTGIISTIAGSGTQGYTGNGGPATNAQMNNPNGSAMDSAGNLYVAEGGNGVIRKVLLNTTFPTTALGSSSAAQNLFLETTAAETIASTGIKAQQSQNSKQEYSVGSITGCTMNGSTSNPSGTVCIVPITFSPAYPGLRDVPLTAATSAGNVTFGLNGMGTGPLAALTPGAISTVAGNGTAGNTGNGGAATGAELNDPVKLAVDSAGNIYISNYNNQDIQKVTASNGYISILAGNGTSGYLGDGGLATSAELKNPSGLGIDSAGNIYIADKKNCRIRKITVATGNIATVAGTGTCGYNGDGIAATGAQVNMPSSDIAFDSDGNWYFGDNSNFRVREVNASTGIITTVAGNGTAGALGDGGLATSAELHNPSGIAVDSSDSIYIADFSEAVVRKVTASNGIISTVAGNGTAGYSGDGGPATSAEIQFPGGIAVDPAGNIYIADSSNNRIRVVNVGSGTISTLAGNGTAGYAGDAGGASSAELKSPQDVALDSAGNLIIADASNNVIRLVTVGLSPLTYPTSTAVGTTDSTDDPQAATVTNIGNASLTISVPTSGTNPSVSAYFQLDNSTTCPELYTASSAGTLAAGGECTYAVDFAPTIAGSNLGSVVLTDNSLNASGSSQTISLSGTAIAVNTTTTVSSSANPSTYPGSVTFTATVAPVSGSALPSGTVQFKIDGSNVGSPVTLSSGIATYATSMLTAGTHSIIAVYTTNSSNYNSSTSSTFTQTVNKATPTVSAWSTASAITYGQTLASSTLSGGTASVGGTFAWTTPSTAPGAGTPLESVTFTPTDTADYNTPAAGSVSVTVSKATPTVSAWPTASAITYGQTLASSTLSGGTASVSGTFAWTTSSTAPGAGTPSESVTFTPTDTTDYNTPAAGSISVTVNKAPLTITASSPTVSYGANVPTITPSFSGFVNSQTNSVLSTQPTCTTTYTATSAAGSFPSTSCSGAAAANYSISYVAGAVTVTKATPAITWATPSAITYGTALSPTQLDATSGGVTGSFVYTPASGTVLGAGSQTLSVAFTPTDTTDYNTAGASVTLTVNKATPTLSVATSGTPSTYGTSVTFTATISSGPTGAVTFYDSGVSIGTGTISGTSAPFATSALTAGTHTITAGWAGNGNYNSITSGPITQAVNKATPIITWSTPAPITYGTPLSSTQLNSTSGSVAGSFAYTPNVGTVLGAGSQTLSVTFTPTDSTDYVSALSNVSLTVNKSSVVISGTALPTPSYFGDSVTLTFTFTGAGLTPTGTTTIKDGAVTLATVPLSAGAATFSTSALIAGTHSLTATYNGDTNYQ